MFDEWNGTNGYYLMLRPQSEIPKSHQHQHSHRLHCRLPLSPVNAFKAFDTPNPDQQYLITCTGKLNPPRASLSGTRIS